MTENGVIPLNGCFNGENCYNPMDFGVHYFQTKPFKLMAMPWLLNLADGMAIHSLEANQLATSPKQ